MTLSPGKIPPKETVAVATEPATTGEDEKLTVVVALLSFKSTVAVGPTVSPESEVIGEPVTCSAVMGLVVPIPM